MQTIVYALDDAGNRSRLVWPDGYRIDYGYDALNRMVSVTQHAGGLQLAGFSYDPLGRRLSFADGGGASAGYSWTKAGDLTLLSHDFTATANDVSFDAAGGFDEAHPPGCA